MSEKSGRAFSDLEIGPVRPERTQLSIPKPRPDADRRIMKRHEVAPEQKEHLASRRSKPASPRFRGDKTLGAACDSFEKAAQLLIAEMMKEKIAKHQIPHFFLGRGGPIHQIELQWFCGPAQRGELRLNRRCKQPLPVQERGLHGAVPGGSELARDLEQKVSVARAELKNLSGRPLNIRAEGPGENSGIAHEPIHPPQIAA